MARKYKLLTAFNVESGDAIWLAKPGFSTVQVLLTQGAWFFGTDSGWTDGASNPHRDLLFMMNQAVQDALGANSLDDNDLGNTLTFTMNSDNTIRAKLGGSGIVLVRFTNPDASGAGDSVQLYDAMRFQQSDSQFSLDSGAFPTNDGTRIHGGGYYPSKYLLNDLRAWDGQQSAGQIIPDEGNVKTIMTARRLRYRVGIRVTGKPRDPAVNYTEYHYLEDWWSTAAQGRVIRFYPDTSVTTAYGPTNRYGYHDMTMAKESFDLALEPQQGNWHKYWLAEFMAYEYAFS